MNNILAVSIIIIVIGNAIQYIRKERKKGTKCIGCPGGGCEHCQENQRCKHPF